MYRFLRCNANKYHKYVYEWISNVLPVQLEYFRKEKEHLNL